MALITASLERRQTMKSKSASIMTPTRKEVINELQDLIDEYNTMIDLIAENIQAAQSIQT